MKVRRNNAMEPIFLRVERGRRGGYVPDAHTMNVYRGLVRGAELNHWPCRIDRESLEILAFKNFSPIPGGTVGRCRSYSQALPWYRPGRLSRGLGTMDLRLWANLDMFQGIYRRRDDIFAPANSHLS
jgi:hypothetical protein